jgi:hypothetical protein
MLQGICDSCGTADEYRGLAVEIRDPVKPPYDVGKVRTEYTPVDVQFVDYDVFQIAEEFLPFCMVWENTSVKHIGIRDDDLTLPPDCLTCIIRGVSIVGESPDIFPQITDQALDFMHLVLRQSFGGKKIKGSRFGLFQNPLQYRQVVAQGFSASCRCHQYDVFPIPYMMYGPGLMRVELPDAFIL